MRGHGRSLQNFFFLSPLLEIPFWEFWGVCLSCKTPSKRTLLESSEVADLVVFPVGEGHCHPPWFFKVFGLLLLSLC